MPMIWSCQLDLSEKLYKVYLSLFTLSTTYSNCLPTCTFCKSLLLLLLEHKGTIHDEHAFEIDIQYWYVVCCFPILP